MTSRLAFAVVLLAATAGNARAADAPVKAVIHPGPLSVAPAKDITSPSEHSQGLRRLLVEVTDARGNGRGWILGARPLGASSRVRDVSICCAPRSTCTLPALPTRLPSVLETGRTTPVLASGRGAGMGRIDVAVTLAGAPVGFSVRSA